MIKSPNQIRLELAEIQSDHLQLSSFYWGDFLTAYKENELNYPLMGAFYPSGSFLRNQTQIQLTIYVADKLYDSWSNLNEVESDTLQICRDIYQVINSSVRWQSIGRVDSCTVTKFIDKGGDGVAGHQMVFQFSLRDREGICNIPMENYDFDQIAGSVCYAAIVENSDASYQTTVASGGTLVLPDITVTDSDGSTFTQPSAQDVTCTLTPPCEDATYSITDDSLNVLYSGSITSGGNLNQVITDSTVTIKDDSNNTLYSVSVNAQGSANQIITDSSAVLKDTANTTISTTLINAQGTANITAPDSTYLVEYANGTDIQSGSIVSGGSVTVTVPNPPAAASVGMKLMKTGQTTSYRTGDDGDLEAGRATDFLTLASNNPFGNTNRFTGTLGGQSYTNDWVIDWSTYDGSTVLGYFRTAQTAATWDNAIDNSLGTFGFFSGCRLSNIKELINILHFENGNGSYLNYLNYAPFNIAVSLWSSTAVNTFGSSFAWQLQGGNPLLAYAGHTTATAYIPVRTFTVTGTTLS
tara:strand:- start:12625 stop:14199 length:1575 start_codon:yes stop_codon:yes gene_type:complete